MFDVVRVEGVVGGIHWGMVTELAEIRMCLKSYTGIVKNRLMALQEELQQEEVITTRFKI